MTYPEAIKVADLKVGQRVILFMTHNGTEREKCGCEFDRWCVPALVSSIDKDIVTVSISEPRRKMYGYASGTVSFYINNRFHEVGKTIPNFRLFLNKGDAYRYEHYRVLNQEYHKKHKEKRNQAARDYQTQNADKIRQRKKAYRHDNPDLTSLRQRRYYSDNIEKIKEYHKKYREENKDEINRKQRETRQIKKAAKA